ncbi:MAG: hypothetical protein OWT28_05530 [Firmicutes bacterium]|nr:hypothetical protein [Bacillota bacterium]
MSASRPTQSSLPTRWVSVVVIILVLAAIGGAGVWKMFHTNPPFQVLLTDEIVKPQARYNPISAPVNWETVTVQTASGTPVRLTPALLPALVAAYWCPHCQRTLVLWMRHQLSAMREPVLISTGFAPGTTLVQAEQLTRQEEAALHIHGLRVYYWLANWQPVVKEFPTLLFSENGKEQMLQGEHTWHVWHKALGA